MFEIGRLCLKIAGREAGLKCIIIDKLNDSYVLINGQTRRRKCNIKHLEPLDNVLKIKKGLSHEDVVKELKKENIEVEAKVKRNKRGPRTEEKLAVKEAPKLKKEEMPELKKEKPAAKPKEVKKPEAKPKKTVVKAKEKVSKAKPKAKTTKK